MPSPFSVFFDRHGEVILARESPHLVSDSILLSAPRSEAAVDGTEARGDSEADTSLSDAGAHGPGRGERTETRLRPFS